MSATNKPIFYTGALVGACVSPSAVDTSLTSPTHTTIVVPAAGAQQGIYGFRFVQLVTTSSTSYVNLFLFDGTSYHFYDSFQIPAQTVTPGSVQWPPIDLPLDDTMDLPAGWSIVCTSASLGSVGNVFAFGGQ